jgi:hypothetical protein
MIRHHSHNRRIAVIDLQGLPGGLTPSRFTSRLTRPNTPGTITYQPPPPVPIPATDTPKQWPIWLTETPWYAWAGGVAALAALWEFGKGKRR